MPLISVITNTQWIDLSEKHKQLREYLEKSIESACVQNKPESVIMVRGAFGIGKTAALHYLFHYGWCKINVPVLFVSLEKLYPYLEKITHTLPNKKIANPQLCEILDEKVNLTITALRTGTPNEISQIFFNWGTGTLAELCNNFIGLELNKYENGGFVNESFQRLTPDLINSVLEKNNRPLLLMDEFETKFLKLKSLIDASDGGELRELYDEIVEKKVSFHLIIGNGPASGYELANEKPNQGSDEAEKGRLIPKQVPFPYPETTKEFLKTDNRGLLNFAWWASRCRARYFLRLKETVVDLDNLLKKSSYAEFLNDFSFFNDSIESSNEGSSSIKYVRTEYLTDFPEKLKDIFLPRLIAELKPIKISFEDYGESIVNAKKYLFCGNNTISVGDNIMVALSEDIKDGILKKLINENKYSDLDYDKTLRKYFDFFLRAIANENGQIVLGMTDDDSKEESFCDLFLLPLIQLTYDFIAQYEEESLLTNKQALEFLLNIMSDIQKWKSGLQLKNNFPKTYRLFKSNDSLDGEGFIQLSLGAIREIFEQPIGEPKLNYRNENLTQLLEKLVIRESVPLFRHSDSNVELYFIPDLPNHLLAPYLQGLQKYIKTTLLDKLHKEGKQAAAIIYMSNDPEIEKLKSDVLINSVFDTEIPLAQLGKFGIFNIKAVGLNFPGHTSDFIDSVIKIGLIGYYNGDLISIYDKNSGCIEINKIVNKVKDWTDRKEIKRTIIHFDKLVFSNDKSEAKVISYYAMRNYQERLDQIISDRSDLPRHLRKYPLDDDIYNNIDSDNYTKRLIYSLLIDNQAIPEKLSELLHKVDELSIYPKAMEKGKRIDFAVIKRFIRDNGNLINKHYELFSLRDTAIQNISTMNNLLKLLPTPHNVGEFASYLSNSSDHFMHSYYNHLKITKHFFLLETTYNLAMGQDVNIEDAKLQLLNNISTLKNDIQMIRTELSENTDRIKELLKLDNSPYGYSEELGKYNVGILIVAERLLAENTSLTLLVIILDLIKYFDEIINDAKVFKEQIISIYTELKLLHNQITPLQEKVNEIYSNEFIKNILTNVKGKTNQSGEYYWLEKILPTVKASTYYDKIFNTSEYKPQKLRIMNLVEKQKFIADVKLKFTTKKHEIDKQLEELMNNVQEIREVILLDDKLKEILSLGVE